MREPISISVALGAVIASGVALTAIIFPGLSDAAQVAIIAFGNALIGLGVAIYARSQSTPTAAPVLNQGTSIHVTTPTGEPDKIVTLTPSVVESGRDA